MPGIALIDYGSGNLHSCARALAAAAQDEDRVRITARPDEILDAERIILPGVGHFADCALALKAADGLFEALNEAVRIRGTPFLGICVGMQLMADLGLEDGETAGLGWIPGVVRPIEPGPKRPVPHVGWNELIIPAYHPVLAGLGPHPHAYFTHSYAFCPADPRHLAASCEYGAPLTAALASDNLFGVQFHPEKSQRLGLALLANFLQWQP